MAGSLVAQVGGTGTVRLSAPCPLDRDLDVVLSDDGRTAEMRDGEDLIATAAADDGPTGLAVPEPVSLVEADLAACDFDHASHPFPGCYVCGSDREDGLRIFPGPVTGRKQVVASSVLLTEPTTPAVWAALDCPGAFAIGMADGDPILLGTMTARIDREIPAGEQLVVMGWATGDEGRKRYCGTALLAEGGQVLARAAHTWVAPAG